MSRWTAALGAIIRGRTVSFRVWAPSAGSVTLVVEDPAAASPLRHQMVRDERGYYFLDVAGLSAGTRYGYAVDGSAPLPDPASRSQPDGPNALSALVDPAAFAWDDETWTGRPVTELVIYELHVGAFTPEGTFAAAAAQLPRLHGLGITAIELMPVAEFPGTRNWGYDGVSLYAPAHVYGSPDDLRRFVERAHHIGLAVLLDVVYNHTGPDGSYLSAFSPFYFSDRHQSPWGRGLNFDGPHAAAVREFFIENALHWVHEYHFDGLRLDATHAIEDDSPTHVVAELTARVKASVNGRHVQVIAEDHRNLAAMIAPPEDAGWGLDAVWADDFHHQIRRRTAGDADGYFRDYSGTTRDIAATIAHGWFFTGQWSTHLQAHRGTDPSGLPPARFVFCLQNHDQIGNRALGDRLHHRVDLATYRAASALFLLLPQTPLLFMGQEWAASSPFLYFTDHQPWLGQLVTEGRRREFQSFAAFASPDAAASIPDPQAKATFDASTLSWGECETEPHASIWRLYQSLLALRHSVLAPGASPDASSASAPDEQTVLVGRTGVGAEPVLVVTRFSPGIADLRGTDWARRAPRWRTLLTTEDAAYAAGALCPSIDDDDGLRIHFRTAATVVLIGRTSSACEPPSDQSRDGNATTSEGA